MCSLIDHIIVAVVDAVLIRLMRIGIQLTSVEFFRPPTLTQPPLTHKPLNILISYLFFPSLFSPCHILAAFSFGCEGADKIHS